MSLWQSFLHFPAYLVFDGKREQDHFSKICAYRVNGGQSPLCVVYLSGIVRACSARLSPHGRRFPSFLGTTRRGDSHGLFDGRNTLYSIMNWNSAFSCSSRSGARRQGLLYTGGPSVVSMCNHIVSSLFFPNSRRTSESGKFR